MKVLLIEDDEQTSRYVADGLNREGHHVDRLSDGRDGLEAAIRGTFDLLIVDRRLPGLDGLSVVRAVRSAGGKMPILFLTTMNGLDERVEGLEGGADDYLVKPFAFSELRARVSALGRRLPEVRNETVLKVADLEVDRLTHLARRGGTPIDLSPVEFRLLEHLMRNKGRVVTRTMLLERVWEFHFDPKTKVVEANISRLRSKIDKPFTRQLLRTVRGAGYMIKS